VYSNVRARLDILESRINNPNLPSPTVDNPFIIGNTGVMVLVGAGAPVLSANQGSIYLRTDGYHYAGFYTYQNTGWKALKSINYNVTNVSANYTIVEEDEVISVDSSSAINITLPSSPIKGQNYVIKDSTGNASVNNVTVLGGANNIDSSTTYVISSNYASINVIYDGGKWLVT
jgi:hypothetical protein